MFPYADYKFYKENTNGKLDEKSFKQEITEASYFLQYITLGKSDKSDVDNLKYAACAIAEMYAKEKAWYDSGASRTKSENTDGYSVTYTTELKDGEVLEDLLARKAHQIARKYLAMTGLLNRKVQRVGC